MEVKDIIKEGRPVEPSESTRHKTYTWYKIGVHDGYDYALEEFENNRLKACGSQTEAESECELNFAIKFFEEHHRQPTFSDAIEETRKQMIEKVCGYLSKLTKFVCCSEGGGVEQPIFTDAEIELFKHKMMEE